MESIILCNTGSDSLSRIRLSDYYVENFLLNLGEKPIGPTSIYVGNNTIYTANSYNNHVSSIDLKKFKEKEEIYFGANPSDLVVIDKMLFVVCSDTDSVIIYDLEEKSIILQIPTGLLPTNIEANEKIGKVLVSNFDEDKITIIDINNNYKIDKMAVGKCPGKMRFSKDNSKLYVCESNVKEDKEGYVGVYSVDKFKCIKRVKVGKCPIDMWEDSYYLYVSNFYDASISIIDTTALIEVKKIYMKGMPKGIVKYGNKLFVGDYLNGEVKVINLKLGKIEAITVGKEPSAMTLI